MKRKLALFQDKAAQLTISGSIAIAQETSNTKQAKQARDRCVEYLGELAEMLGVTREVHFA